MGRISIANHSLRTRDSDEFLDVRIVYFVADVDVDLFNGNDNGNGNYAT